MITLAVIGAGRHSCIHHGPAIVALRQRLGRVVVTDLNPVAGRQYAQRFGLDASYTQITDMFTHEQPDGLIVVTPETITAQLVRSLLPYDLPMMVEKPFGENLPQSQQLCQEVAKANARIMISFNRRFAPVCTQAMTWLQEQFASRPPQHCRGIMLRHGRFDPDFLTATAVHVIDALNMFAGGCPLQILPQISWRSTADIAAVSAQLRFADDRTGELLIHSDCGQLAEQYEILGPGYRVCVDYFHGLTIHQDGKVILQQTYPDDINLAYREGAIGELDYFINQLEIGSTSFSPNPNDAVATARVATVLDICSQTSRNHLNASASSHPEWTTLQTASGTGAV